MSKRAVEWAKAFEASRGVWMPRSYWRALRVVAQFYHEGLGCAFPTMQKLAEEAGLSVRHMRRTMAELNELGLVKRNAARRIRDKSDASNEYELTAYRVSPADAAMRSQVFSIARERIIEQARLKLPPVHEGRLAPWMLFLVRMRTKNARSDGDKGRRPAAENHNDEGGCPVVPVDRARNCPGEEDGQSVGPRTSCPPVDLTKDYDDEEFPPYAPPESDAELLNRGKASENHEQCWQSAQSQEQAHRSRGPASPLTNGRPMGASIGVAALFPNRHRTQRGARDLAVHRASLDGFEAALWDETTRVLRACGVSSESSGRKIRRAIEEALHLESEISGAPIAAVGQLAVQRWQEYKAQEGLLFAPLGITRFFAEGEWLRPGMWRYNHERVREIRRGPW